MTCLLCDKEKPLVKSHIIPASFYRALRGTSGTIRIAPTNASERIKRSRIGVWDKQILCAGCEKTFGQADNYADSILNKSLNIEELRDFRGHVGYKIKPVRHDLLKRFVITLLWRASVSKMPFFRNIDLGPLERKAKELIKTEKAGGIHDFSFVLAKFNSANPLSKVIFDPILEKWFGRKYYRFYLGGYVLYVKADSQETPKEWRDFLPNDDSLIIVNRGAFEASNEYAIFLKGIHNISHQHKVKGPGGQRT